MKRQNILLLGIVVVAVVAAVVFLRKPTPATPPQTQKISVRMKWFFAGTMTGWFAGRDEGFFKDQGIDLTINPGGPDNSSIKLVAAGSDTFGVAGADEVLIAREKGIPIVAIGVLFKDSPICFISKKSEGITSPTQWAGKTVEVSYGDNSEIQYRALVKKFDVKNIKEVPYTFSLLPFIQGKVDVSVAYKMDQLVTLQNQGIAMNVITPKEYGINPYGDVVFTTEKTLKENPDLAKRFMEATVKGFQWSIDHPDQAVQYLIRDTSNLNFTNELQVWKATIPFLTAEGGVDKIGVMSAARWKETEDILLEFKALNKPEDLNQACQNVLSHN